MSVQDNLSDTESKVNIKWKNLQLNDINDTESDKMTTLINDLGDSKALRMMQLMGYKSGLGLGKNQQGIKSPIKLNSQLGVRGLGLKISKLDKSNELWDYSQEEIQSREEVVWFKSDKVFDFDYKSMVAWIVQGKQNKCIEEEIKFCDKKTVFDVLQGKNIFDEFDPKELSIARSRSNPFETIKSVFFMNRAALKMANIDAATGFLFTSIDRSPAHRAAAGPIYFADVCAGPGGFTEYVLWRKKWLFKGFGLTLRAENDFRVHESTCASGCTFLPLYGAQGDGDVCNPANVRDFAEKVRFESGGVHFVMADGGFSVEGDENMQEVLSKRIYAGQCLVALEILRAGGHFVTKLFDLFTEFSVGLVFLLSCCFEKIAIFKPNSSRPANSERYFIGEGFKNEPITNEIKKYLRHVVEVLWKNKLNELDVVQIVPFELIQKFNTFFEYIYNSNTRLAKSQTVALKKLAVFCQNPNNFEPRQKQLRAECLQFWQIPDKPKSNPKNLKIGDFIKKSIDNQDILLVQPCEVKDKDKLKSVISDLIDWHFTYLQSSKDLNTCNIYAGVGDTKVYKLVLNKWVRVKHLHLVKGTILYGEVVRENVCETIKYSLHVIDALRLGNISLADLKFIERQTLIQTYCKSVNHEFRSCSLRVRPKVIEKLSDFRLLPINEGNYVVSLPILGYRVKSECFYANSILLLKSNNNQSFHSSYVLRLQIFISPNNSEEQVSLEKIKALFN